MKPGSTHLAFQTLVEFSVIYHHLNTDLSSLFLLANELQLKYPGQNFEQAIHSTENLKKNLSLIDEDLFIQEDIISALIKDGILFNYSDRIEIYTQIILWIEEYKISPPESNELIHFLLIDSNDAFKIKQFIANNLEENIPSIFYHPIYEKTPAELEGAWIEDNLPNQTLSDNYTSAEPLKCILKLAFFESITGFLVAEFSANESIKMLKWERLLPGDHISICDGEKFSFSEAKNLLITTKYRNQIYLKVDSICKYIHRKQILKELSFSATPGSLIGIVGKDGTGKSTLLQLLSGKEKPTSGEIEINHHNFRKNQYLLKGTIGYIPEEDLLINELTVEENLYLAARLYLGKISQEHIRKKVEKVIHFLNLQEIRNICPGSLTEKHLQPGERRLVNIGLELLRDPSILIVDNATHSLGMNDTAVIIEKLAAYTFEGKIVVTSITQTHESVFKSFDQIILLDHGGYPVFAGLRTNALHYFKQLYPEGVIKRYNKNDYTPDTLIDLVNEKEIDLQTGNRLKRFHSPYYLFEKFRSTKAEEKTVDAKKLLPVGILKPPSLERQYILYNLRNIKTLIGNKQALFFTVLAAPLLAFIMAYGLKSSNTDSYTIFGNQNLPIFFSLSCIVFTLLGLLQGADSIFKERFLLSKEVYLNLSRFSYMNAKISLGLLIVLIQSIIFSFICSFVLQINFILGPLIIIIFSAGAFGVISGLFLSATVKQLSSIYTKFIPVIILLEVIFGSGFIDPNSIGAPSKPYPPLISELMPVRWLHEALLTQFYKTSPYYQVQGEIKQNFYYYQQYASMGIPLLEEKLNELQSADITREIRRKNFKLLRNTLSEISDNEKELIRFEYINKLYPQSSTSIITDELTGYLKYLELYFGEKTQMYKTLLKTKDDSLKTSLNEKGFEAFKKKQQNQSINNIVESCDDNKPYIIYKGNLLFVCNPIYQIAVNNFGRSILYAPAKHFNGQYISTLHFNLTVVWFIILVFYIILITNFAQALLKQ